MNNFSRKQINDVIVPQNDIIRRPSIVPEPSHSAKGERGRIESNPFFEKPRYKKTEPIKSKKRNFQGIIWASVFVLFLAGGFAVASYFVTAVIEIVPITRNATLDNDFTAVKDATNSQFAFQLATFNEEKTKEVSATIEKKILTKASGKVVLYNAYSAASQKLIKNTRLESPDHKIYRINESIVVPGAKVVSGKVVTPGSVEAVVYADVPGEEYNIGATNFTIPGFAGDPRYAKFTASSKPDSPISGGFSGTVKVPSDEAVGQAREELKLDLKKIIVDKAHADIPDSMTFFPGSMVIKFEEVPQDFSEGKASNVSVRAVASVFFFDSNLLTEMIAGVAVPDDKGKIFTIRDMSALTFTFLDPVENMVLSDISKIRFNLKGDAIFVGAVDAEKLKQDFAGKNKKDFSSMVINQNNIYKADATIRPAWKTVFPTDPSRITVKIINN